MLSFCRPCLCSGEHGLDHRISINTSTYQRFQLVLRGRMTLCSWWQKGRVVLLLPSSPKGEIVGIMIQVLSLMATHSDDNSQCSRSTTKDYKSNSIDWRKRVYIGSLCPRSVYTRVNRTKGVYMYTRTFSEEKTHMEWKIKVLVQGIWSEVFGLRYWSEVFGLRYWS